MGKGRNRAHLAVLLSILFMLVFSFSPIISSSVVADAKTQKEKDNLVIHFIDVGQGDATFIELPSGKTLLIDGGTQEYGDKVVSYISDLGYKKIDCIIATHSDSDHIGGLSAVLCSFEVKHIFRPFVIATNANPADDLSTIGLTSSQILYDDNVAYTNFINLVYKETYNDEFASVSTLSSKSMNDVLMATSEPLFMIEIIYPFAEAGYDSFITPSGRTSGYKLEMPEDTNDLSAIIFLSTEKHKVLLMSDASEKIENELINLTSVNEILYDKLNGVDVMKMAHHGSKKANSSNFLELVKPKVGIISVGAENDYGHPDEEMLERLSDVTNNIHRTDNDGTIVVSLTVDGKIEVNVEKGVDKVRIISEPIMYAFFGSLIVVIVVISVIHIKKNKKNKK